VGGVLRSELKHRVPMFIVEDCISNLPKARSEQLVIDTMELGGDKASLEIEDLPNCGMMFHGLTKVHATARLLLPLGQSLPILQPRVKDVHGTSPDAGVHQHVVGWLLDSGEELERGKLAARAWKVIPQVDGMLDHERPQFWPLGGH
jgi:hypothetical protein